MPHNQIRVLLVCLGNICRSPLAEVVVKNAAKRRGLDHLHIESAGTGNWHVGGAADIRSAAKALQYGLDLSQHRAQQITASNIHRWHWFVAMDGENRRALLDMGAPESRVILMRQFESAHDSISENTPDVPDPYYGGSDGFEHAYQMLVNNTDPLLDFLESRSGISAVTQPQ